MSASPIQTTNAKKLLANEYTCQLVASKFPCENNFNENLRTLLIGNVACFVCFRQFNFFTSDLFLNIGRSTCEAISSQQSTSGRYFTPRNLKVIFTEFVNLLLLENWLKVSVCKTAANEFLCYLINLLIFEEWRKVWFCRTAANEFLY